jgi:hypothetical protein
MASTHIRRTARRSYISSNPTCEPLEKREVLSAAGVASLTAHSWSSHDRMDATSSKGAETSHFDHTFGGTTVAASSTTSTTGTTTTTTGFPGFGPGGPGGKGPTLPAAVTAAQTTLQNDLKSFETSPPTKPSAASLAQLQTDMKAVQAGTLTGTAATTQIQADQNAILASEGLTTTQIATINSDQAALQAAMKAAFPNAPTPPGGVATGIGLAFPGGPGGMSGPGGKGGPVGKGGPGAVSLPASVKTVVTQLETDTKAAIGDPPKAPSAASLKQLRTDLATEKAGTLTGTTATTQIQNDKNAILASQGATAAQIATINSDQTSVQAAFKTAFPNAPAMPSGAPGFNPGGPMMP